MSRPHLVTLFDRGYAARGLVLLDSLARVSPGITAGAAKVSVYALDDTTETAVRAWGTGRDWLEVLGPARVARLDAALPGLERSRSRAAFCWTLTPLTLREALRPDTSQAVYVDADLVFHADPLPGLARLAAAEASAHITPHGFAPEADHSASVGRYCVQFLPVRNDDSGRAVVERWARQCLADCPEGGGPGPPGDQGYLDEWRQVHGRAVADWDEPGVGCGPWNRSLRRLRRHGGRLEVSRQGGPWDPLLFVHQQDVKWDGRGRIDLARLLSWPTSVEWLRLSTLPYLRTVARTARRWLPHERPAPAAMPPLGFWPRWLRDSLAGRRL